MHIISGLLIIFYCSLAYGASSPRNNPRQRKQQSIADPTASKTPDQVKEILNNLSSLSEPQLQAFGTTNTTACASIKKVHLEKGNPFRFTLINPTCLGSANVSYLERLIRKNPKSPVQAVSGNRQFWCPYAEATDLSRWGVKDKSKMLGKAGCPGHQAPPPKLRSPHRGESAETARNRVFNGLLIAAIVLLSLVVLAIIISIITCLVRRRRRRTAEMKDAASSKDEETQGKLSIDPTPSHIRYYNEGPSAPADFSLPPPSYDALPVDPSSSFQDFKSADRKN